MEVFVNQGNICIKNVKNYQFPLKYLIFGSKNSLDLDIAIWIPLELVDDAIGKYNQICARLDRALVGFFEKKGIEKKMNSCLVYWENSQVVWSQKGTLGESHNSYVATFNNHRDIQMYNISPLSGFLKRDVAEKICGATRMIVSTLTSAHFINSREMVRELFRLPEIRLIPDLHLFVQLLMGRFAELTINKSDKSELSPNVRKKLAQIKSLRSPRNQIVNQIVETVKTEQLNRLDQLLVEAWEIYDKAYAIASEVVQEVDLDLEKCLRDGWFDIDWIAKACLKSQLLTIQLRFLQLIDWSQVDLGEDAAEKYKKIAFQLGQTIALTNGEEIYDKDLLAEKYPILQPMLYRQTLSLDNLKSLTEFVLAYVNTIFEKITTQQYGLHQTITELSFR